PRYLWSELVLQGGRRLQPVQRVQSLDRETARCGRRADRAVAGNIAARAAARSALAVGPGADAAALDQRRASVAIVIASPISTVPINQRCTTLHSGCAARNMAILPAATAIIALTVPLIAICTKPSASACESTLPAIGSMNCGSSDR